MRRLAASLAAVLGAVLAVYHEFANLPDYEFNDKARYFGTCAVGLGILVAILVGKATKVAAGRDVVRYALVYLVAGGVIAPLCLLLGLCFVFLLLAGAWGLWSISMIWYYWLRAWVAGGVLGMLVALFWPADRHAVKPRASK